MSIKFVHTNLIAKDWRKLAQFYIDVFGCKPQYPERNLSGELIEQLTGIKEVKIGGIHLVLPGYDNGPTLEIFEYEPAISRTDAKINRQGFGHIAFHVEDVEGVALKLIKLGGKLLGETTHLDFKDLGLLTVVYAQDPEGNLIEIQNWGK